MKWAQGVDFATLCAKTDIFEGGIIRSIRLLEELLRQMTNAARTIGNNALIAKFTEGISHIALSCGILLFILGYFNNFLF